jgi:hypothetical protein
MTVADCFAFKECPLSISLSRSIVAALLGSVLSVHAFAQTGPRISVRPQVRVLDTVDSKKSTVLANSVPAIVANATDKGRLAASTALPHLKLVLKSSDEQETALRGLLDDQQDKSSPNYHKWMTPDTFGSTFGAASVDIAKVSAWLQDSGFSIDTVSLGGRVIQFSGTSGQVETAFKTEMHKITVNGESHISNTTNISVPTALLPVIVGVASLNDFRPRARAVNPRKLVVGNDGKLYPVIPGTSSPDYTSLSSGNHYVGAADLETIYNGTPLTSSGINGTGVTIGIIGQTSINLSDVQTYRQLFNLPVNDPQIINVGPPPATIADDIESDLDVELAGALATNATIKFYTAGGSLYDGGVDTSALSAVDTNGADIISLSYGGCELSNGSGGTAYWNTLWEQAAAQGQTVFVSSGDSSATGCASSSAALATGTTAGSYGVNALGSGAYNVAVGGSMFNEGATATTGGVTPYWGAGGVSPYGTALSYIPENVWSEGVFDPIQTSSGIAGGGGGVSIFTARPSWQVGPGITAADPAGPTFTASGAIPSSQLHRLVPDVSLIAASGHDGTIFCSEGVCKINSDGTVAGIGVVGGTSVATPTMAGVQALINQKNGGRQGNANYYYYKLAAAQTTASCASTLPPAATCNFNDIVSGSNYSPKTSKAAYNIATGAITGTLGTDYIGFPAGTGYDVASGLGTPNITNLANNWSTVTFNASKTALTLTPTTLVHGTAVTATITVTASAGTPTGQVSLIAVGQAAGASDGNAYTLNASGSATATVSNLPGGTYSVVAHYAGDSVYGASDSAPVTVTISKEPSTTFLTPYNITTAGAVNAATTYAYGTSIYFDTDVQGNSATSVNGNNVLNTGTPTGTVAFTVTSGNTTLTPYTSNLDAYGDTYLEVGQTFTNFLIYSNYPAFVPGSYTVKAAYSGDNSFGTSNASSAVMVVKASVAPVLRAATAEIASGATASFNVTIAASGGGVLPTGTITLTDTTTSTVLGSGTLANGAVVITSNLITTNGGHSIVAAYGGDANYNATSSTAATVTVGGTATSLTLTPSVPTAKVLTSISFVATAPTGVTGTVYFYDGALTLGSATISTTTHLATLAVATLTAGTHNVTATYAGSTTYQAATSSPAQVIVTQNTPTLQLTTQQANATAVNVAMSGTLALSPANSGAANPAPSVPIQFLDGTTVLGSVPLSYTLNYHTYNSSFTTTALKPGPHTLTASFAGDTNYAPANSNVQTINIGLTTTTVTSSTSNVGTGIPFTLTANVAAQIPSATAITGTVTFYDGTTPIGTATVTSGVATLSTATLTGVGTHSITAVYSGDANYYTSTSSTAVSIVTVTPNFTIAVSPTSLTVNRGGTGTLSITSTVTGNYYGFANYSCVGLPANTICVFSQNAALMSGADGTKAQGTITIYTAAAVASNRNDATSSIRSAGLLWIPALFLAGFLGLRRKQLSLRCRQLMTFAILLCGMMAISGCNDAIVSAPIGTPTGTTTFTVVATGNGVTSASPSITATTTVSLTVQ